MPQLIDMFAPTRQTLASMGQAFAADRRRGLDEEDRVLATERHDMMMDRGLADLNLKDTQQQAANMSLEDMQKQRVKKQAFDDHMSKYDKKNGDHDRYQLEYLAKTDPEAAAKLDSEILKKALNLSKLDPKSAIEMLNKKTGRNLEYVKEDGDLHIIKSKSTGVTVALNKETGVEVWRHEGTPEVKKQTKAEIDAGFEKKLAKEYAAMDPELTDVEAMVKAKEKMESIKLKGKHTPKSAVVQNFGDMEKKEIATAAAKDKAFWTGTKAREKAGEIAKAEAGDDWEDLETSAKKLKTKLILNRKITSVYPDAKFGEDNGIMGWYVPDETGKMKIIQRWND